MKILSLLAETELSPAELRLIREMVDAKLKAVETRELDAARVLALWGILRDAQQAERLDPLREFLGTEAPESSITMSMDPGRAMLAQATLRWALTWPQATAVVALWGDIPGFIEEINSLCELAGIQTKYQDYLPGHNGRLLVPGISPIYMCALGGRFLAGAAPPLVRALFRLPGDRGRSQREGPRLPGVAGARAPRHRPRPPDRFPLGGDP